jgi:PIN domain nuclease of toxin-antitoxin system
MSALVLDTHVVHWWSAEPERLSQAAVDAIEAADDLAVSAITWFELAWLARHGRIRLAIPIRVWLAELSRQVLTLGITPSIAETAVSLPPPFPGDSADRVIYATAIEHGARLVTKDRRLRDHPQGVAVW